MFLSSGANTNIRFVQEDGFADEASDSRYKLWLIDAERKYLLRHEGGRPNFEMPTAQDFQKEVGKDHMSLRDLVEVCNQLVDVKALLVLIDESLRAPSQQSVIPIHTPSAPKRSQGWRRSR
jgi:hypothetical protein